MKPKKNERRLKKEARPSKNRILLQQLSTDSETDIIEAH